MVNIINLANDNDRHLEFKGPTIGKETGKFDLYDQDYRKDYGLIHFDTKLYVTS